VLISGTCEVDAAFSSVASSFFVAEDPGPPFFPDFYDFLFYLLGLKTKRSANYYNIETLTYWD
jgi:hypothetical protein